jgi:hypothetical protein
MHVFLNGIGKPLADRVITAGFHHIESSQPYLLFRQAVDLAALLRPMLETASPQGVHVVDQPMASSDEGDSVLYLAQNALRQGSDQTSRQRQACEHCGRTTHASDKCHTRILDLMRTAGVDEDTMNQTAQGLRSQRQRGAGDKRDNKARRGRNRDPSPQSKQPTAPPSALPPPPSGAGPSPASQAAPAPNRA